MKETVSPFGVTAEGAPVRQVVLRSGPLACGILTYGGAVRFLTVPGRTGNPVDVALGFDTIEDYQTQDKFMGALMGRHANRIGGSAFTLNGKRYPLLANDGENHLHGGAKGFDKQVWTLESASEDQAVLSLVSPDGQEGYPGNLSVQVTYTLRGGALAIHYEAQSDAPTLCNLTSHGYFNLAGHDSGSVLEQELQLFAEQFTPSGKDSLPVGVLQPVAGTPMDFRTLTPLGARIDDDFDQLRWAGGYDHNWVVDGKVSVLRPAAKAVCRKSGVTMEVETTSPGVQLYTGNYLGGGGPAGKGGAVYRPRDGFCLETQFFPNATNCPVFLQPVLMPGARFDHTTVYRFGTL